MLRILTGRNQSTEQSTLRRERQWEVGHRGKFTIILNFHLLMLRDQVWVSHMQTGSKAITSLLQIYSILDIKIKKETVRTKILKDASTQTESIHVERNVASSSSTTGHFDCGKLYQCLIELFCGNILQESRAVRKCLMQAAMRHSFGANVDSLNKRGEGDEEETLEEEEDEEEILEDE